MIRSSEIASTVIRNSRPSFATDFICTFEAVGEVEVFLCVLS
ncbi:hypothetical protein MUK42_07276 [Musa troglodytarum]|uniref:Uncharacterized protein n=1 Tax=Musa troglodytarum TaxID=320322 RepID=A0A9E7F321_9LILI|nr:hypothetical protein MUK42_07276 [Musa troglodytarum]